MNRILNSGVAAVLTSALLASPAAAQDAPGVSIQLTVADAPSSTIRTCQSSASTRRSRPRASPRAAARMRRSFQRLSGGPATSPRRPTPCSATRPST